MYLINPSWKSVRGHPYNLNKSTKYPGIWILLLESYLASGRQLLQLSVGCGGDGQLLLHLMDTHCEEVLHGHGEEEVQQADVEVQLLAEDVVLALVDVQPVQLWQQHFQHLRASWPSFGDHGDKVWKAHH